MSRLYRRENLFERQSLSNTKAAILRLFCKNALAKFSRIKQPKLIKPTKNNLLIKPIAN